MNAETRKKFKVLKYKNFFVQMEKKDIKVVGKLEEVVKHCYKLCNLFESYFLPWYYSTLLKLFTKRFTYQYLKRVVKPKKVFPPSLAETPPNPPVPSTTSPSSSSSKLPETLLSLSNLPSTLISTSIPKNTSSNTTSTNSTENTFILTTTSILSTTPLYPPPPNLLETPSRNSPNLPTKFPSSPTSPIPTSVLSNPQSEHIPLLIPLNPSVAPSSPQSFSYSIQSPVLPSRPPISTSSFPPSTTEVSIPTIPIVVEPLLSPDKLKAQTKCTSPPFLLPIAPLSFESVSPPTQLMPPQLQAVSPTTSEPISLIIQPIFSFFHSISSQPPFIQTPLSFQPVSLPIQHISPPIQHTSPPIQPIPPLIQPISPSFQQISPPIQSFLPFQTKTPVFHHISSPLYSTSLLQPSFSPKQLPTLQSTQPPPFQPTQPPPLHHTQPVFLQHTQPPTLQHKKPLLMQPISHQAINVRVTSPITYSNLRSMRTSSRRYSYYNPYLKTHTNFFMGSLTPSTNAALHHFPFNTLRVHLSRSFMNPVYGSLSRPLTPLFSRKFMNL